MVHLNLKPLLKIVFVFKTWKKYLQIICWLKDQYLDVVKNFQM